MTLNWVKDNKLFAIAIVAVLVVAITLIIIYFKNIKQMVDSFQASPFSYDKELNLFKSMSPNDQAEYLELSKEMKQAKYGAQLV